VVSFEHGRSAVLAWAVLPAGCRCEGGDERDELATTGSGTGSSTGGSRTSSGEDPEAPFDASRWVGRYHYEDPGLAFGERGEPSGPAMLYNFEIFEGSTATLSYDDCSLAAPLVIDYTWVPTDDGWLSLNPGADETSLRFGTVDGLLRLRVLLIRVPCRELRFELDGYVYEWLPFRPGASCWIDRCTTPGVVQVDYCEGEEPPACP
jgi:hypothetical protein